MTTPRPVNVGRRRLISTSVGALGVVGAAAAPVQAGARARIGSLARRAPGQLRERIGLPSGVLSGDVTTHSAVLWGRADAEGTLIARIADGRGVRTLRGPLATEAGDFTARLDLAGLAPGREYDATLWFESASGVHGESAQLHFRTAPSHPAPTSFAWSGDHCGGGWGINPDLGGLTGYAAVLAAQPDFYVHCRGSVFAADPLPERVVEPDGSVWHNLVTPEVTKVAETLAEFRGRHRYNLLDEHLRTMATRVPVVAQWDDHESSLGWSPGQVLEDARYVERRVDVLAARARRAWQEYQPISADHLKGRGRDGFASARIYRHLARGAHLDLFCLDLRVAPDGRPTSLLGEAQTEWLIREATRSRATWKVLVADLPVGLAGAAGTVELKRVLSAFRAHRVRNVVWVTAGLRHAAAHHYSPERASYSDFDGFWEFAAGPIAAGAHGAGRLDPTFGPRVVWSRPPAVPNESPRHGHQSFGHAAVAADGLMTVTVRDAAGQVWWELDLEPVT